MQDINFQIDYLTTREIKYTTSIPTEYQYRYTLGNKGAVTGYQIVKTKAGYEETSSFDCVGNLASFADGNGKPTNFQYDRGGRIKKEIYPDGTYQDHKRGKWCDIFYLRSFRQKADNNGYQWQYQHISVGQ